MKKILILIYFMLAMSACSKKGGSGQVEKSDCVFSTFTTEQIMTIQNKLAEKSLKFKGRYCDSEKFYQDITFDLTLQILNLNSNADIEGAISKNDLSGFLLVAVGVDGNDCSVPEVNLEKINLAKQCDWKE